MHNGMLTRGGEKMSKSLGNDMTIRGVVDTWGREVALMLLLSGQWRKPLDFNQATEAVLWVPRMLWYLGAADKGIDVQWFFLAVGA